jgi:hypothetical protein
MSPAKRTKVNDVWFVRLPDGQVLQARTTAAVRHHIQTGGIPRTSQVRRAPDEEWTALEWTREFSAAASAAHAPPAPQPEPPRRPGSSPDLPPVGIAGRLDPLQLKTVGVRGLVEELLAALDSTLLRGKLTIAAVAGVLLLVSPLGVSAAARALGVGEAWAVDLVTAGVWLLVLAVATTVVSRTTFIELSRMRPARRPEVTAGLVPLALRLVVAALLVPGVVIAAIILLPQVPGWVAHTPSAAATTAAEVIGPVVAALLWLLLGVSWLLAPVLVVEEASVGGAVGQWLALLGEHRSRAFLYEAMAVALGGVVTVPFLLPVVLAFGGHLPPADDLALALTARVLTGLAVAPLLAFLMVANVFIYLNLRYEAGGTG